MESRSPSPVSRCVSRNSEKRAFPSSVLKDVEVLEIPPPPSNRSSKLNSSKQKEVICHEIIDVDSEELDDGDVLILDGISKDKGGGDVTSSSSSKWSEIGPSCRKRPRMNSSFHTDVNNDISYPNVLFKKFDIVEDYSDHRFAEWPCSANLAQPEWAKRIQQEWKILEKDLPDAIFVRVYESRMDLLRAVIVGAEGTPYHDGLFFFDFLFPPLYPILPPEVLCHCGGGGVIEHPAITEEGICLSLLMSAHRGYGTGGGTWIGGVSTMLQVLVTFQGLVLTADPYFEERQKLERYEKRSLMYNEMVFMRKLEMMVYNMRCPPKHFEEYVVGHFRKRAREILVSCKAHLDGASSSVGFKYRLASFMTTLVDAFSRIGAKDCRRFLYF